MKKLLPLILLLIGTGAGVGAGIFLRPPPPEPVDMAASDIHTEGETKTKTEEASEEGEEGESKYEYAKLSNQFVIPIVEDGEVASLVVMALSLEVKTGSQQAVFQLEPKLRDSFLQVMFDHANIGGFRGMFTNAENLDVLRAALREVAIRDAGEDVTDVLILEIARQDY